jgi:hypothetical protein
MTMDRRRFITTGVAAGALGPSALAAQGDERHYYELRVYEVRSDIGPNRLRNFLRDHTLPALQRAGAGPVGAFTPEAGFLGQSIHLLIDYRSAADVFAVPQRLSVDPGYATALRAFEAESPMPYVRYESRLLRAFAGHPRVEVTPGDASRPGRLFEIRTYESRSAEALGKKVGMFDVEEIALFRSIGMTPVFFGEDLYGPRLPSLTYMISFPDMAARTQAWNTFRTHPDWQRMSRDARWQIEGGNTSVTSAAFLNPLPFSQIR